MNNFKATIKHLFLIKWVLLLALFTGCIAQKGLSQTPGDTLWIVETMDGNVYQGTIGDLGRDTIQLKTTLGVLNLPKKSIREMKRVAAKELIKGEFWSPNPHHSRHFWGPSGYGIPKGEGYYQNILIVFNQVSYGITDNLSVGVGLVPLFLFGITETLPVWVTPKLSFPYRNGKGSFGVGTLFGGLLGEESDALGILYGVNTFGTREKQVTVGLGYGYSVNNGFADYPTVSLSGMMRTSRKFALITENYLISGGDLSFGIISGGARYMGKRLALDFGGLIPLGPDMETFLIPWLGIAVPFK